MGSRTAQLLRFCGSLLLASAVASACSEQVLLGSECESHSLECHPKSAQDAMPDGGGGDPSGPARDASQPAQPDAGQVMDALAIANKGFERSGGLDGDIVLKSTLMAIENPLSTIPIVGELANLVGAASNVVVATLPDWYACWPLSVTSNSQAISSANDGGTPLDHNGDYVTIRPPNNSGLIGLLPADDYGTYVAVRQALQQPMVAGQTIYLTVDVLSRTDGADDLSLDVLANQATCGKATLIGNSATIRDSDSWTQLCIELRPDQAYDHLLLQPRYHGTGSPPSSSVLLLDNVRALNRCPN